MNTGAPLPGKVILGGNMQWSFRTPAFLSCPTEILPVTPDFQSLKNAFRTTWKVWKASSKEKKKKKFKSGRDLPNQETRNRQTLYVSNYKWLIKFATLLNLRYQFSSVQSLSRVQLLRPHDSQQTRPSCLSPTPRVHSDSCLSSR